MANFEVVIRYPSGTIESIYTHEQEWFAKIERDAAIERGMRAEIRDLRPTKEPRP